MDTLLQEGQSIAKTERNGDWGAYIPDSTRLHAFETRAQNVVELTFGTQSLQAGLRRELSEGVGLDATTLPRFWATFVAPGTTLVTAS